MSTNPLIPIVIEYNDRYRKVTAKDMGRLLSALKRPGRIRAIDLDLSPTQMDKFFKATKCAFPALESLALRVHGILNIPGTFLKGTNLHLRLRVLRLHSVSLTSISRLLSSATALTDLSLKFYSSFKVPDLLHFLTLLQGLPYLCSLMLKMSQINPVDSAGPGQLPEPKERFALAKLTSFDYNGHSACLDILAMGFEAPSLEEVYIHIHNKTLSPITHFLQFVNDVGGHYHKVQVVLNKREIDLSLLTLSDCEPSFEVVFQALQNPWLEDVVDYSSRFRMRFPDTDNQNWITEIASILSAKLSTVEELVLRNEEVWEEVMPWRTLFKQLPSVKKIRLQRMDNSRIARALLQHGESCLDVLPALERITILTKPLADHTIELLFFQPFVSARQQVGRQVQVTCSIAS